MNAWLWSLRWRFRCVRYALTGKSSDGGGHRFIDMECLCGHRSTNDPNICPLVW
jgi:hypothetical protein